MRNRPGASPDDPRGCQARVAAAGERFDVAIVDVPFPRHGGVDLIQRVATAHPSAPIVALSSAFFADVSWYGAVARGLGVACALPKPVAHEALTNAIRNLLPRSR